VTLWVANLPARPTEATNLPPPPGAQSSNLTVHFTLSGTASQEMILRGCPFLAYGQVDEAGRVGDPLSPREIHFNPLDWYRGISDYARQGDFVWPEGLLLPEGGAQEDDYWILCAKNLSFLIGSPGPNRPLRKSSKISKSNIN